MRYFYSSPAMTNMQHVVQPHPGSRVNKLWNRNIHDVDPDPLFAPKHAPPCLAPLKVVKRSSGPHTTQPVKYNFSLIGFDRLLHLLVLSASLIYVLHSCK